MEVRDFFRLLWRQKIKIFGMPLLAGLICLLMTQLLPRQYEASASFMIAGTASELPITGHRAVANNELIETCISIMNSKNFLLTVVQRLPFKIDVETLQESVRFRTTEDTGMIIIQVRDYQPLRAADTANIILGLFPSQLAKVFPSQEVIVVERAVVPTVPYSNIFYSVGLTVFISFQWVLSLIMFITNKAYMNEKPQDSVLPAR